MKPCSYPGCIALVQHGRCARHRTPKATGQRRRTVDPFYKDKAWLRIRKFVLERDEHKCVKCNRDVSAKKAAIVDHIQPRKERPDLALEVENLRTLCRRCDNKRHSEKGGFAPRPVVIHKKEPDFSF